MSNKRAMIMVRYAVDDGFLPPVKTLKCVDCGKPAAAYDHRNYDYPLSVDATCTRCNVKRGKADGQHDIKNSDVTTMTIQLPVELKEQADKKAESMDMPTAQYIRKLIKDDVSNAAQ